MCLPEEFERVRWGLQSDEGRNVGEANHLGGDAPQSSSLPVTSRSENQHWASFFQEISDDPQRIPARILLEKLREIVACIPIRRIRDHPQDRERYAERVGDLADRRAFHFNGDRIGQAFAQRPHMGRAIDELIPADDQAAVQTSLANPGEIRFSRTCQPFRQRP